MTHYRWQLATYVFVSIILRMVAAQLSPRRTEIAWVRFLSEGWAASVLRFVYYIGLPYVALILGVVPGRYLGLVGVDWLQVEQRLVGSETGIFVRVRDYLSMVVMSWLPDVGTLAGLAVITLVFLSVTWLGYAYLKVNLLARVVVNQPSPLKEKNFGLMQVIYQAVHWSFYRSAIWLLSGDLYLGVVGGIVLVGGEWMLDPSWMAGMRRAQSSDVLLISASVLIATSVMFFFVPNLWLLMPIHGLLAIVAQRAVVLENRTIQLFSSIQSSRE